MMLLEFCKILNSGAIKGRFNYVQSRFCIKYVLLYTNYSKLYETSITIIVPLNNEGTRGTQLECPLITRIHEESEHPLIQQVE